MGVEIINTLLLVFRRQIGEHDNLRARGQGFQRLRRTGGWLNVPRLGVEKFVDEVRKLDRLIVSNDLMLPLMAKLPRSIHRPRFSRKCSNCAMKRNKTSSASLMISGRLGSRSSVSSWERISGAGGVMR